MTEEEKQKAIEEMEDLYEWLKQCEMFGGWNFVLNRCRYTLEALGKYPKDESWMYKNG